MNEEELFCKLFPEYVVNGKPLSPYFDLFESGYEQAENRFAELQERIKTLEYRCENIKDTDTMELVALQRENAELQHKIDTLQGFLDRDVEFDNLQKENAKLKADYGVLSCSVGDFGELQDKLEEEQRKNNGLSDNLTKAKEIIKKLLEEENDNMYWEMNGSDKSSYYKVRKQAEQFIRGE